MDTTINTPEPVKPPSNGFSSTTSQQDMRTPFKVVPDRNGCRSVKSIVAWLESSSNSQPWSPRTNTVDMTRDLSAGSVSTFHEFQSRSHSASGASDVEDYSLTFLKYKNYFTNAPLVRCLDPEKPPSSEHQRPNISIVGSSSRPSAPDVSRGPQDGSRHSRKGSEAREHDAAMTKSGGREVVPFIQRDPEEVGTF
ncbi:uncharacterized protein MAM_03124 [Metarhizium album ARSEF 1941]|uniref:Uncharacterized protein n=1 Tax=Metarhizium album (strain ARSEF 1941) TaxID=1081103 RepID=A0A0B2WTM0_METAS|nr:uncharacterized protein MAM_03124 [Metarhizium album ARSEF 1941]KHN99426.1 hypothetical protein MAM_03124 [Metarhizium album ARSEF 1941]